MEDLINIRKITEIDNLCICESVLNGNTLIQIENGLLSTNGKWRKRTYKLNNEKLESIKKSKDLTPQIGNWKLYTDKIRWYFRVYGDLIEDIELI